MKTISIVPFIYLAALIAICAFMWYSVVYPTNASSVVGNDYQATTTYSGDANPIKLLKIGSGSLGSVVITGDNTGITYIYNATTTNVSLRAPSKPTSTVLIAEIPASAPENTYVYDVEFTDGLIVVSTGAEATSTITYR